MAIIIDNNNWSEKATNPWRNNSFQAFVQIADNANMQKCVRKIKDSKLKNVTPADAAFKPAVFLLPMSKWHLYSEFKQGINVGGKNSVCLVIWYHWFFCFASCLYQFYESKYREVREESQRSRHPESDRIHAGTINKTIFSESLLITFFFFCRINHPGPNYSSSI